MKIINPCEGLLSDFEVLAHIKDMKARYTHQHNTQGAAHAMKAGNLETVMKGVKDYLSTTPSATQSEECIQKFMAAMSPYAVEKAELLMMVNLRPSSVAELDCIIEEMDQRFSEEEGLEILALVKGCLPLGPKEGEELGGGERS